MAAEMKGTGKELEKVARYSALKKEVEANVELYNSLVRAHQGSWNFGGFEVGRYSGGGPGRVPDDPIRPRRLLNLAVGFSPLLLAASAWLSSARSWTTNCTRPKTFGDGLAASNVSIIPMISEPEAQEGSWVGRSALRESCRPRPKHAHQHVLPGEAEFARG